MIEDLEVILPIYGFIYNNQFLVSFLSIKYKCAMIRFLKFCIDESVGVIYILRVLTFIKYMKPTFEYYFRCFCEGENFFL